MSAAVELQGIHKSFRVRRTLRQSLAAPFRGERLTALDGVTCQIPEGEFFGLLGVNGAGKTTLFKILSTLTSADSGRASVFGVDVARQPARVRQLLAPVFVGDRTLAWRLSALENLRLYGGLHRLPRREVERRAGELLELVGLAGTGGRLVGTFSSGMKQRLLLARALMARPRLLLLDEPTRSLDPIAARSFREFLRRDVGRTQGCTVVLATHDPDEVRDLCDRVGVLHQGRLVATGTPQSLSAQLGFHRYRLVTSVPDHPAVRALAGNGARLGRTEPLTGEWQAREIDLPADEAGTASVVAGLAAAGVPLARFERIELPLADLIERITRGDGHA